MLLQCSTGVLGSLPGGEDIKTLSKVHLHTTLRHVAKRWGLPSAALQEQVEISTYQVWPLTKLTLFISKY